MIPKEMIDMLKSAIKDPVVKVLIVSFFAIIGVLSVTVFKMKENNPIEVISEEVIKDITGIEIDLTPKNKDD